MPWGSFHKEGILSSRHPEITSQANEIPPFLAAFFRFFSAALFRFF